MMRKGKFCHAHVVVVGVGAVVRGSRLVVDRGTEFVGAESRDEQGTEQLHPEMMTHVSHGGHVSEGVAGRCEGCKCLGSKSKVLYLGRGFRLVVSCFKGTSAEEPRVNGRFYIFWHPHSRDKMTQKSKTERSQAYELAPSVTQWLCNP